VRVKELADLTGTTVRAIRYYHQIGLLPVPDVRYGCRDYDLLHVARLTRIRWLAQAGVPLSRIAGLLDPPTGAGSDPGPGVGSDPVADPENANRRSIVTDLNATVVALEEQLELLQKQRDQVRRLVVSVEQGDHLSMMPSSVVRFYDDLEHRAGDERTRRVVRAERDFMELAFYRGDMPPESEILYAGLTDAGRTESLALFEQIAARSGPGAAPTAEAIEQIAAAVVQRITRQLGPDLPRLARSIDLDVARRAADLYVRLAGESGRLLGRAIGDALVTAIEKERAT
jgi:DNA-binding transcriptional MerR regulator